MSLCVGCNTEQLVVLRATKLCCTCTNERKQNEAQAVITTIQTLAKTLSYNELKALATFVDHEIALRNNMGNKS